MREYGHSLLAWPGAMEKSCLAIYRELEQKPETLAGNLAEEHSLLFTGPDPLVPLWESVWLEREKLLFGKRTEQIERLFADWGLSNSDPDKNPLDHLAFEMGLLAWLIDLAAHDPCALSESGQNVKIAIKTLLHDHIMAFAPAVLVRMTEKAVSPFYRGIAENALLMLNNLASQY